MVNCQDILEFQGVWRDYQQRVLNQLDIYKKDHKIHIVAAPGSGKTTLGIEIIRRVNKPALILVPTITIRQQWVTRIKEAFLKAGLKSEEYISQDLKHLRLINVSTYQSIHSAMRKVKDQEDEENVDYQDFSLIEAIKEAGIETLCLDECHHLRTEWWKALEDFKKQITTVFTISLTATPPYDSSIAMWTRYLDMCGDIDIEITVPELVKEGSLCPHQDYVYFNYPTAKEEAKMKEFQDDVQNVFSFFMHHQKFQQAILSHPYVRSIQDLDKALENPAYLSSLLIYLESQQLSYPREYLKILGTKKLEKMSIKWMEILLQGFFFDDRDSYTINEEDFEELYKYVKSHGLIEKKKVIMQVDIAFEKMLISSVGKCESIRDIVCHEYKHMNRELKLLILTDYIKGEYEKAIGDDTMSVHALGVLPFFEMLRRESIQHHQPFHLAVLCGSMIIIPAFLKNQLRQLVSQQIEMTFQPFKAIDDYVKVNVKGNHHEIIEAVSDLFEQEDIQVLIGTKSLLGEGWDSPCVNTLILASFVGSFMLSNQMRGRAIRTYHKNPDKVSHIWHLVCVPPQKGIINHRQEINQTESDFENLRRRMEHFLGLHYDKDFIENGIERLTAIQYPLDRSHIKKTNQKMLELSSQREQLKERWNRSLAIYDKIEVVEEVDMEDQNMTSVLLYDAIRHVLFTILSFVLTGILICVLARLLHIQSKSMIYVLFSCIFIGVVSVLWRLKKVFTWMNPLNRLQSFGDGIYQAMLNMHLFEMLNCRVQTESQAVLYSIYLSGGTAHDKALFAKCVNEFFDEIDNQRYILYNKHQGNKMDRYFVVPDIFSKRKEDAMIFAQCMQPYIGKYQLIYTRNEAGRKILLQGRKDALANRQNRLLTRKKVKGALE